METSLLQRGRVSTNFKSLYNNNIGDNLSITGYPEVTNYLLWK